MKTFTLYIIASIYFVCLCTVVPYAAVSEKQDKAVLSEKTVRKPYQTEREAKAYEIFEKILVLTETSGDKDVFQDIENLYLKIISDYSDTALAQECYWRLIKLYLGKRPTPLFEKAETLYAEFLKKYPESVIKNLIVDTLSKSYYRNGNWKKLLTLNLPAVRKFRETGKLTNPSPLFMYAEAQFNLGQLEEAGKAYRSLIELFPNSRMSSQSKKRLDEIQKKNSNN